MNLDGFGLLILISKGSFLDEEIIITLNEINLKLAQVCLACVKIEILEESEMRYRHQQELLPEMISDTLNSTENPHNLEGHYYVQIGAFRSAS